MDVVWLHYALLIMKIRHMYMCVCACVRACSCLRARVCMCIPFGIISITFHSKEMIQIYGNKPFNINLNFFYYHIMKDYFIVVCIIRPNYPKHLFYFLLFSYAYNNNK
jgi:hypothetical protein